MHPLGNARPSYRQFKHKLDLHGRIQRQRSHPDRRPCVSAGLSEQFNQQLTGRIGNLRLLRKRRGATDKDADANHAG